MCNDCWASAKIAARAASRELGDALRYLKDTREGLAEPEHYVDEVQSAAQAVANVPSEPVENEQRRATELDVAALEQAQAALISMSSTDADQVRPYRDYSSAQLELGQAVQRIRELWVANPVQHRA